VAAGEARARVLREVAPTWRLGEPGLAEVRRLSATDVNGFVSSYLHGGGVTVSVVAATEPSTLLAEAGAAFASLPRGRRVAGIAGTSGRGATPLSSPRPGVATAGPGSRSSERALEERTPLSGETQVAVVAGLPGVRRDDLDRRTLELLNYIVGVPSYGGRLGWALTKAGLTYSSAAATTVGATGGHITFTTRCDSRNLDATIQAIREVIAGVGEQGVDQWELDEAKAFTLGRALLYGPRDDSGEDAIAAALLDSESAGEELLDLPAWSRRYLAITLDQVNAAARRYYRSDQLKVVAIGALPPAEATSPFLPGTFRALFDR